MLNTIKPERFQLWLLAVLGFSAAAFLVRWAGLTIPVAGSQLRVDPREIFVILGAAHTGPIGGAVIGFCADLPAASFVMGQGSYIVFTHIVSGFFLGWLYRQVYARWQMPALLAGWVVLVIVYYYALLVPVFITLVWLTGPESETAIFGANLSFLQMYSVLGQAAIPELVGTLTLTTIIFMALPHKYRRPLSPLKTPAQETSLPPARLRRWPVSRLAIRLALWFILFSSLPLLVLILFVRQNTRNTFEDFEQRHYHRLAVVLAGQVAEPQKIESVRELQTTLAAADLTGFILNTGGEGTTPASTESLPWPGADNLSAETRTIILGKRDGVYVEPPAGPVYAFAPISGQEAVLVIVSGKSQAVNQVFHLERASNLQLLAAILIMFIGSGVIVWLLVGLPVQKLTTAAGRVAGGQYDTKIDPIDMIDDLAVLGTTFNTMTDRVNGLVEDLEQRVTARTEELSAFFDLTLLAGQVDSLSEVFEQAMSRILEVAHVQALCLHFINDDWTGLRLATQQNLSSEFQAQLQTVDLPTNFR